MEGHLKSHAETALHEESLAPALPLLVGLTAGVLAALVVDAEFAARHLSFTAALGEFTGGGQLRIAAASALWAIAGVALAVGAAAAALLGKYPPPWHKQLALRWIIGALILFGLAHVAHGVESPPHEVSAGIAVLAEALVIVIAAVMALAGAFFARPRS